MQNVKISVGWSDQPKILCDLDKSIPLEENIKVLIEKFELPTNTTAYGLKLLETNNGKEVNHFITESNYADIKDGYFLQVVYSSKYEVQRIFDLINAGRECEREKAFDILSNLYMDESFIKEMVAQEKHEGFINFFTYNLKKIKDFEMEISMLTIIHLLKLDFFDELTVKFITQILTILEEGHKISENEKKLTYAMSILHKILVSKKEKIEPLKMIIISNLWPLSKVLNLIERADERLQYTCILFANTALRHVTEDVRQSSMVSLLSESDVLKIIYDNIIKGKQIFDAEISHELFIFQTLMLNALYRNALKNNIETGNFEVNYKIEMETSNRCSYIQLFENDDNEAETSSRRRKQRRSRKPSIFETPVELKPDSTITSELTLEAVRFYKITYSQSYCRSHAEERKNGANILETSDKIIKILAKILNIGRYPERPNKQIIKTPFQPLAFKPAEGKPYLFELYSRLMWLFVKTRIEMKAINSTDLPKVYEVLKKQIYMILDKQAADLKILGESTRNTTFKDVSYAWQIEKEKEFNYALQNNECLKELKEKYVKANTEYLMEHRVNYLLTSTDEFEIAEQKKTKPCTLKVSQNKKELIITEIKGKGLDKIEIEKKVYELTDIDYLVVGTACPHKAFNGTKGIHLIFSIIVNHNYINLIAKDLESISYWLDGLSYLIGKDHKSELFATQLSQMVHMDLKMQLIELQNVTIPKSPPPVPPEPDITEWFSRKMSKPPVSPKPQRLLMKNRSISTTLGTP